MSLGWGSWAGKGIKENKKKKKKFVIKGQTKVRKDSTLGNVIISEKKDSSIKKFMVIETLIHEFRFYFTVFVLGIKFTFSF